ncbi:MAG TPA: GNAT family N-acetyltransferase [Symbiobacteriaceae bacterium]|nr:GNAT family N-acetyltransferase [Symbiobacteriaceae bacterium]
MGLVQRWRQYARQYGTKGLVRYLLRRAVHPVWERSRVQLLVAEPPPQSVSARVPLRIDTLTAEAARRLHFMKPGWEERWARGETCYVAWKDDTLVHHSWVSAGSPYIGEAHVTLRIDRSDGYIYDCFTDGSCRGMGIFPAVLGHITCTLFGNGAARVWIAVEEENISSIKAIQRGGFRLAAVLDYRRLGPWVTRTTEALPGTPHFSTE